MNRKMCASCPFKPNSLFFNYRDDWGANLDNQMFTDGLPSDGSVAHICHEVDDHLGATADKK